MGAGRHTRVTHLYDVGIGYGCRLIEYGIRHSRLA